jgi:uncharacterized integral membrane protein (TIGR00697 family)
MVTFVTVLLCSNLIGVSKIVTVGGLTFGGGNLFFPISYLFGDILTEVYGYARTRRVVWAGFGALLFSAIMTSIVIHLPPAESYTGQSAIEQVFGSTPRIVAASMIAYFAGEFTNSYVLAKMKLLTRGKYLWTRTIGSTVFGEAVDSTIFYPIAFLGTWDTKTLLLVATTNYFMKVLWEILATPLTYRLVAVIKKAEQEDFFDNKTDFSPFSIRLQE